MQSTNQTKSVLKVLSEYLTPAGNGVFTVETAKEKKQSLHKILYNSDESKRVIKTLWQQQLEQALVNKDKPYVLGICSDCGGGILRGANWGPLFVREELYKDSFQDTIYDLGDIRVIPHLLHDSYLNNRTLANCRKALYKDQACAYPVSPLSIAEAALSSVYDYNPQAKIYTIGGDHSISYATVSSYLKAKNKEGIRAAVIHFDAHTDLSATRLGIDINFSTWAYKILPLLKTPQDLIQLGIRSSRHDKKYWEDKLCVQQFWSKEIASLGVNNILDNILSYLEYNKITELFVSFDIDAIDSQYVSATGTPEKDGILPGQALELLNKLSSKFKITGADLAEVAPFIKGPDSASDQTIEIAAEISKTLVGAMSA